MTAAHRHSPSPGITRRIVATGAAWSVPVATVATAAPALAASGSGSSPCLSLSWTHAVYMASTDGSDSAGWALLLEPAADACSAAVVIVTVEVWTTYHAPAVTNDEPQLVATYTPGCRFGEPGNPWPDVCQIWPAPWTVPPVDEAGASLLPGYYGLWYPGDCIPIDYDPNLSCDVRACERLQDDGTFLLVTYQQADGSLVTQRLDTFLSC